MKPNSRAVRLIPRCAARCLGHLFAQRPRLPGSRASSSTSIRPSSFPGDEGTNKSNRYGELLRGVHDRPDRLDSRSLARAERSPRKTVETRSPLPAPPTGWPKPSTCAIGKEPLMLLKRHFERLLLSPSDLKPLRDDFQVVGSISTRRDPGRRRGHSAGSGGRAAPRKARGIPRRCRAGRRAWAWRSTGSLTMRSRWSTRGS